MFSKIYATFFKHAFFSQNNFINLRLKNKQFYAIKILNKIYYLA